MTTDDPEAREWSPERAHVQAIEQDREQLQAIRSRRADAAMRRADIPIVRPYVVPALVPPDAKIVVTYVT